MKLVEVSVKYRNAARAALDEVTLRVAPGEAVCIMGRNGSGKSTLARVIAGLITPESGSVELQLTGDSQLPVGLIFQNPDNQMVAVTVEKEIVFSLENLGCPQSEMEERLSDICRRLDIVHLRNRMTAELSGGEKQRVALASVLITEPEILILDEPDSFLDQDGKQVLEMELQRAHAESPNLIELRITQYPEVARRYRRLVVLDRGRIEFDGEPEALFSDIRKSELLGLVYRRPASDVGSLPRKVRVAIDKVKLLELGFGYNRQDILFHDLTCDIERGRIMALVGPSGSGKSTLGLLIAHLLAPVHGRLLLVAHSGEILEPKAAPGAVAATFQQPERQFFLATVEDELQFGPGNMGRILTPEELTELCRLVGLGDASMLQRDPLNLSGGEKRRLAFAVVLALTPDVIVFDEPTCGLDPEGVGQFIGLVEALADSGTAVVLITHDGSLLRELADQVLLLTRGETPRRVDVTQFETEPALQGLFPPATMS